MNGHRLIVKPQRVDLVAGAGYYLHRNRNLYTEIKGLFRNVPPRLYLAMAATDQDEKNLRARVMRQFNCSEIEAIKIIAHEMMQSSHLKFSNDKLLIKSCLYKKKSVSDPGNPFSIDML